jgi:hypothetical protein
VDNRGALVVPFIGSLGSGRRAVKGREAAAVELQWRRLWEMEMRKRRWAAADFRGGRGGGSTVPKGNDTANSDAVTMEAEGGGWRLEVEDEKKLGRWVECEVGPNCWLGQRKEYGWEYQMGQKDRRRNIGGPK